MLEGKASRTSLAVAYMRAAHQLFDPPPRILEDPVAVPIIGEAALQRIRDTEGHYQTPERRGFRAHIVLRSRFAEDRLADAVRRGIAQYVVLGAGLDTFALRQPEWARSLSILEVDHAATQAYKRSRLAQAGLAMPANATFAAIDFTRESLHEGLFRHGFSTDNPTFFSCLGVIMYLDEEVIDAMLRSVAKFPIGSEIVLTYNPPPRDPSRPPSPLAARAASVGEPWLSYVDAETLGMKLRSIGFSQLDALTPEDAEEKYLRPSQGKLPAPRQTNILAAIR